MPAIISKKRLGQHFLKDSNIARKIVNSLNADKNKMQVLEIGPGLGMLTKYLLDREEIELSLVDKDKRMTDYLCEKFPQLKEHIICDDFLKLELKSLFNKDFSIIGNFPYNISSQILFKILDYRDQIPEVIGMFQKEVADRMVACSGNKQYGILSIMLQAYYRVKILFKVNPLVFSPKPKVQSAVVKLSRNDKTSLGCDENKFIQLVKTAFNQRRKMLRNSLGISIRRPADDKIESYLNKRPEELTVNDFVLLTNLLDER